MNSGIIELENQQPSGPPPPGSCSATMRPAKLRLPGFSCTYQSMFGPIHWPAISPSPVGNRHATLTGFPPESIVMVQAESVGTGRVVLALISAIPSSITVTSEPLVVATVPVSLASWATGAEALIPSSHNTAN